MEQFDIIISGAMRTDYIKFTSPGQTHFMRDDCVIFDHNKVLAKEVKKVALYSNFDLNAKQ